METYRGTVYPWHCDHMGHMNVMWYVGKFDEATWQLFAALGLTPAALAQSGRAMAAVDQHLTYLRELHAGDTVMVRSRVVELKERSLVYEHAMHDAVSGEVVARCTIKGVHIDALERRSRAFDPPTAERARALAAARVTG